MKLEDVLTQGKNGSSVHITIVSNQDNGIASYAVGDLIFHPATGGPVVAVGHPLQAAHMESAHPLTMFFSDRTLSISAAQQQPFAANQTEPLGVSVSPGFGDHQTIRVRITVFGNTSTFDMNRQGNLFVGVGPQFGGSPEAVYVLAFTGITHPPA